MLINQVIDKINELNAKKRERELTSDEMLELDKYRKLYLENFRRNFKSILDNTKVINENGEDITPKKKGNI